MKRLATAALLALTATTAHAASISPTSDSFGTLAAATFGGSGIPNDAVAFSTFTSTNGDTLTLGLSATPRFSNDTPSNDGAGSFTALTGLNNLGNPGGTLGATWNFGYYAATTGTSSISDFGVQLLYDLDPGANTDESELGILDLALFPTALAEGSQNAAFGFLSLPLPGITPPSYGPFDPNAQGEYTFALRSSLGDVAINVNTTNIAAVPLPATGTMLIAALGLLALRRKT